MITMLTELCLISLLLFSNLAAEKNNYHNRRFEIDYENDQFLLDGKPFRFIAGSFHYFRAPKQYWRNIFRKIRAAGLNTVTTYVEWRTHEPEPNKWIWSGDANIIEFIKLAEEEDLLVILRPGPYICGERDLGGLPSWLLTIAPDIKLRTGDERFIYYAERYLNEVLTRVKPLLRANGGPIIMVQVENEYGSLKICDNVYKTKLYEIFTRNVGNDAVLFTVDGMDLFRLQCGQIPGIFATIDFSPTERLQKNYRLLRAISPQGPFVNSEYYTGWLTHWNHRFSGNYVNRVVRMLDMMLWMNASVNMYMFYGGTNYGFSSGSNANFDSFKTQITSYDYDAPISEAGDLTPKYYEIRRIIAQHTTLPNVKIPPENLKKNYGQVSMTPMLDLFTEEGRLTFSDIHDQFTEPPTFEHLHMPHGLVLYEPEITSFSLLTNMVLTVKDRAMVYVNGKLAGILSREFQNISLTLTLHNIKSVKFLVESLGHVNFGNYAIEDFKGIFNVSLNNMTVSPWTVTGFRLDSITDKSFTARKTNKQTGVLYDGPQFLVGYFEIKGEPCDTFLNTKNWGKGFAYINGKNLGRYWPTAGPQITLYIAAPFLKKGKNCLVLLELETIPVNRVIQFSDEHNLNFSPDELKKNNTHQ